MGVRRAPGRRCHLDRVLQDEAFASLGHVGRSTWKMEQHEQKRRDVGACDVSEARK